MDLDLDGFQDIVTGQYHPGIVTWFRGSEDGFLPGKVVEQEGDPATNGHSVPSTDPESFSYWNYTSVAFGDLDRDGDLDMVVGGGGGLRVSLNIGTRKEPKFGRRWPLVDRSGDPLMVRQYSEEELARRRAMGMSDDPRYRYLGELNPAGDFKTQPVLVDWNRDGELDLLVGDSNAYGNSGGVHFFRGLSHARFAPGVQLMTAENESGKWLPGDGPRVFPTDWNNDGVPDLLIGVGVPMVNGQFSEELAWEFSHEMGVESPGKAPGRLGEESHERMREMIRENPEYAEFYGDERLWSLEYKGYVYLLLGEDR